MDTLHCDFEGKDSSQMKSVSLLDVTKLVVLRLQTVLVK